MANAQVHTMPDARTKIRNVLFVLVAVGLFLLKRLYTGPFQELVLSYAGNITASFALYYVFLNLRFAFPLLHAPVRAWRFVAALPVLMCVESFEAFDGFGVMANSYDPMDLLANALGVGCALGLDAITSHERRSRSSSTNSVVKPD
jgi:hypothetical protein